MLGLSDKPLIKEMSRSMVHRGPDDEDFYVDDDISLGHRRLSIIDLVYGKQPLHNEDRSIWLIGNGEIYNYKILKKQLEKKGHSFTTNSDNEIPIHLYEEYGKKCVENLRGMFAFAIWNSNTKELFIARDRIGIKPIYYAEIGGQFLFASEIKAILRHPYVSGKIDPHALHEFLVFRYVPGPRTMFKGIMQLQPGHLLTVNKNGTNIERYWSFNFDSKGHSDVGADIRNIESLLRESIEMRLMSEVPLGVFLSGGTDSSAVVAIMSKMMDEPVKTFSVGFGDEEFNELPYAKLVAEHFETDHHELFVEPDTAALLPKIVWHFDEPVADPAALPTLLLSEFAKKKVTVVLTGEGGDELFAGYEQYKIMMNVERYRKFLPQPVLNMLAASFSALPTSVQNRFFPYASRLGDKGMQRFRIFVKAGRNTTAGYLAIISILSEDEAREAVNPALEKSQTPSNIVNRLNQEYFSSKRANDLISRLLLLESEVQLPDNLLMKVDKMTMAHSIEARVPILDHNMVEYASNIPSNLKIRGGTDKYLFRKAIHNYLPKEIVKRRKARFFVPIDIWLKGEFGSIAEELLRGSELINSHYVDKIYRGYSRSELYYGRQLWNLINLELWNRIFVKGNIKNPNLSIEKLLSI